MKKIKLVGASIAVALALVSASSPLAASASTRLDISEDESTIVTGTIKRGYEKQYRFEVPVSGTYIIKTYGSYTDFDTEATLTDETTGRSWTDDDSGSDLNFKFQRHLIKGHTYNLAVYGHGNAHGDFKLKIYKK